MSNYETFPVPTEFRAELLAKLALSEAMREGKSRVQDGEIEVEVTVELINEGENNV